MATKVAIEVDVKTGEANDDIIALREELEKVKQTQKEMSDQFKAGFEAAEKGAKGASKGMTGFGNSIGGVLKSLGLVAIAVEVFIFLKELLMQNQVILDAFNVATTALQILFQKLFERVTALAEPMKAAFSDPKQAVLDLWEAIKENIANRIEGIANQFTALGAIIQGVFDRDLDAIKEAGKDFATATIQVATGLDEVQQAAAVDSLKSFAVDVKEATVSAVEQADALVKLRNEVKLLEADQRALILVRQKEAEEQRQIRDDVTKTLAERIKANQELGAIQAKQLAEETAIANKRIELAERELALDKNNIDLQVALKDAKTELADVEERIAGQKSEQLTNEKALEQELFDLQNELRLARLDGREKELEEVQLYYDELAEKARRSGEDIFEIEAARGRAINELNEKFRKEDLKNEKKNAEDIKNAKISAASETANAIGAISDLVQQMAGENAVAAKVLAVAELAINTAVAISNAVATASKATNVYEMVAGIAAGVAAVVSTIGQAEAILNSAPIPGGGGGSSIASVSAPTAPVIQPVTTNTTELGGAEQAQLAPIQAYVVETEVTGNQNNVNQIESQATFGG